MDDDIGPIARPRVGAPAAVIPRGGAPGGHGTLAAERLFTIDLAAADIPWQYGDDVIISVGEPGAAVAALARFREARPCHAIFTRQSPWRPFDRRAFARYRVRLEVLIPAPPGPIHAAIVDLSLGGCAVEAPAPPPPGSPVALTLLETSHLPPFPAAVVRSRPAGEALHLWHLRFEPLEPRARTFLQDLVAALAAALQSGEAA
ncbi:PilZ domain-containing protein [Tepidiforma sp.]|uniref:PilZ domain-containing protein n=1 Tax=Tepidiforma sp. TaxID=2682230 RepID=UPI002ADD5431|nr:PilZ domain-containing protein [Tepidiforma sp.]